MEKEKSSQFLKGSLNRRETDTLCNPLYLLLTIVVTIFSAELLIMILFWFLPLFKPLSQALIDSSLLILITFPSLYLFVFRPLRLQIKKRQRAEEQKDILIIELRQAVDEVKTLQGIIPICASCKKIRDDHGYWQQVETYVSSHSNAAFSHGICPDCVKKLYSEYADELECN